MKIKIFLSFVLYVVERFAVKYQSNKSSSKQASLGREPIDIKKYLYFYFFSIRRRRRCRSIIIVFEESQKETKHIE